MTTALTIVAGGFGALARYAVGAGIQRRWPERPLGTAVVNITGAAALGVLLASSFSPSQTGVLAVGLLGGYTTFSTWMVDTWALSGRSHWTEGIVNVVGVLAGGWAAYAVTLAVI